MKFDYIREFVTAAKSAELQQAAATLHITPSSLTKHMSALEGEIGADLFLRTRGTQLSRFGKIFLPWAEQLAELHDTYALDFSGNLPAPAGKLRIGISPVRNKDRVRELFDSFAEARPGITLEPLYAEESTLCEQVTAGACDCALVSRQLIENGEDDLICFPFFSYRLSAIFLKEHPLAGAASLGLEQLRYIRIVMDEDYRMLGETVRKKCRALGFEPDLSYYETYEAFNQIRGGESVHLHPISPELIRTSSSFTAVPVTPAMLLDLDLVLRREALDGLLWTFLRFALEKDKT